MDVPFAQFGRMKTTEQREPGGDPADYEDGADETNIVPSIRDNEYMQHSTLWGAQYMSGWVLLYGYGLSCDYPIKKYTQARSQDFIHKGAKM